MHHLASPSALWNLMAVKPMSITIVTEDQKEERKIAEPKQMYYETHIKFTIEHMMKRHTTRF
jgi:hypothetical protein